MKIYIAGKITGLDIRVAEMQFTAAANALRKAGHTPLCPTEMFPVNPIWDWAEYMLADLRIIWHHADGLLMLGNWKESRGANLEHHAAVATDKPIYYGIEEIPNA
jgi:hypothetical protein